MSDTPQCFVKVLLDLNKGKSEFTATIVERDYDLVVRLLEAAGYSVAPAIKGLSRITKMDKEDNEQGSCK